MSASESALSQSIQRTLEQGEEYSGCGILFPAWLIKKLKAVTLLETDGEAGLALMLDGVTDERDAIRAAWMAMFNAPFTNNLTDLDKKPGKVDDIGSNIHAVLCNDDLLDEKDAGITGGGDAPSGYRCRRERG